MLIKESKDKYNSADGRLGRSDRKETDNLLEVREAFFQGIAHKVSLPVNIKLFHDIISVNVHRI